MDDKKHYIRLERHKWSDEIEKEKQETRKRFVRVLLCLVCFALGFGACYVVNLSSGNGANASLKTDSEKLNTVYDIMKNEWYFGKDIENLDEFLLDNAIRGMLTNELDIHTNYLDKKRAESYLKSLEGTLVGIGISYTNVNDKTMVIRVYNESPAKKAGMQPGDVLTKINGISLEGLSIDEVKELATGEEGSSVKVEVQRGEEIIEMTMVRESVGTSVYGYEKDGVAVLEISSFAESSDSEVESYLKEFKKQGLDHLIIDLRDNSGGYLATTIRIASFFMDEGKIVIKEETKDGNIVEYKTQESPRYEYDHIVVLVNEDTASASEALTACLKEQIDATVVGVKTYGKGTVQHPIIFEDGSYLKYTVAEWLTPKGDKINGKGIAPDKEVKLDEAITYTGQSDGGTYQVDSVGEGVKHAQMYLSFLGYDVDRKDGYYSNKTLEAVKKYQADMGLEADGVIDKDLIMSLLTKSQRHWYTNKDTLDTQMREAIQIAKGK